MANVNPPLVPVGLRELVKTFAKELLHKQPENVPEYAVQYFESMQQHKPYVVSAYETQGYGETVNKTRKLNQFPLSAVFAIFPKQLTQIIKEFIKAVLRENPKNLVEFAVHYFQRQQQQNANYVIDYSTYVNYISSKKPLSLRSSITCPCGRTLSNVLEEAPTPCNQGDSSPNVLQNHVNNSNENVSVRNDAQTTNIPFNEASKTEQSEELSDHFKRVKSVVVLQRYFRRILKNRRQAKEIASLDNVDVSQLKDLAVTKNLKHLLVDKESNDSLASAHEAKDNDQLEVRENTIQSDHESTNDGNKII